MTKIDFKKNLKHLYEAPNQDFVLVDVPPLQYLMIDGHGTPGTGAEYIQALEALYPVAYKLKFASKQQLGRDYVVPPLEGLWWAADWDLFREKRDKSQWDWTMMILTPDWIDAALYAEVHARVAADKDLTALEKMRLETLEEGLCAQILHIGSYDDETPTLARLHDEWLPANGLAERGKHHEIYLSDPRKVAPEKLRTVLRQPVRRLGD